MSNSKKYNIGLDIGVASVGWAITDENGELIKRQNKNLWGSRIFNEANTAAQTRMFRGARRRTERRKERINMLQSLLQDDMEKEYPNFFQRLRNTSLIYSDKDKKIFNENYNLFDDSYKSDDSFYASFPTIYHLRNELVHNTEKMDFRMVYLALHHIIKYRGNFLYEGEFSNNTEDVKESLNELINYLRGNYEIEIQEDKILDILSILKSNEILKRDKVDEIKKCFSFDKDSKQVMENVLKALIGYKFEISKVFEMDNDAKISFSTDIADEDELINNLKDNAEIYNSMKNIYSWVVLQGILNTEDGKPSNISYSFINKYEKHKYDLKLLKNIYKEYYPGEYDDMFRTNLPNNYVSFRGKNLKNEELAKCDIEEFYKNIEKKIKELPDSYIYKTQIENDLKNETFLRKLNTTDNGAIPHQLHKIELEIIIDNQGKYYKSLKENKDKIIKIFEFRIPYYVGPLTQENNKFSWLVRNSNDKIRPWNIEEIINVDDTAEAFIRKLTNKCTYLLSEDVMPRYSLLYSKFCVLNELNNVRVITKEKTGTHLDKKTKQNIINEIFMRYKNVNKKHIINYLNNNGIPAETITGLSDNNNFTSNLASYIDMKKIFGSQYSERNFDMYETLIYWITIFEDKKILKRKIQNAYPNLSDEQIKQLVKLKYAGWSRLSKQLLIGEKSYKNETIMEILENTNKNFMQIITDSKLGFDKIIEKQLSNKESKIIKYKEDINTIPTSPANKRAIWQSIGIVKELVKVMGHPPKRIYIEFARNEEEKVLKDKRAIKLLKQYEGFIERNKDVYENLKKVQKDKNITEKMYLYFMQNGQCMYSGEHLSFEELNKYEVDHILPQSYIKDDSLDNKALVKREHNQRKKDSLLLEDSIIDKRTPYWKMLLDNGLITQTKYYRLIRRTMLETDTQKVEFVNRQLVETRQITKHVTNLLKNYYKETEVFAIRSEVISGLRSKYKLYKNRNVNDYHHAHDAYLLCVAGNVIEKHLKYKDEYEYGEYIKRYFKEKQEKDTTKKGYGILVNLVSKHVEVEKMKKILEYKDCYLSRMLEEGTGEFYNQTIQKKRTGLIRKKSNMPTEIYGGYTNTNKAYMCIFGYKDEKRKQRYNLIGIPIKIATDIKNKKLTLENYIKDEILLNIKYSEFKILKEKILLKQQYIDADGSLMRLASEAEIKSDQPLIIDYELNKLINLMNRPLNQLNEEDKDFVTSNLDFAFETLLKKLEKEYLVFKGTIVKLKAKKNDFLKLSPENKTTVINELVKLMSKGQGNLKLLGLTDREGRMNSKNFNEKNLANMIFINQSITGIYERRYKIDGLEDSTSK